jgi:aminopeptidase N
VASAFAHGPEQLKWITGKVGPFPFATYGNFAPDLDFGYSVETQGFTTHSPGLFDPNFLPQYGTGEAWFYDAVMVHEIAHQWYGDSVMPGDWADLWLNEGFATWFEKQWDQEQGTIDKWGYPSLEEYFKDQYSQGDIMRALHGPVAKPVSAADLFNQNVYDGGALVLFALQQKVGDEKFQKILRGWAKRRGVSVTTEDFIAYASRISGQNLTPFLREWLYGTHTPAMPGHGEWTVAPVTATTTAETRAKDVDERVWSHNRDYATPSGVK